MNFSILCSVSSYPFMFICICVVIFDDESTHLLATVHSANVHVPGAASSPLTSWKTKLLLSGCRPGQM